MLPENPANDEHESDNQVGVRQQIVRRGHGILNAIIQLYRNVTKLPSNCSIRPGSPPSGFRAAWIPAYAGMTEWSAVLASSLGRHPGAGRGPGVFVWFNCQELLSSYTFQRTYALLGLTDIAVKASASSPRKRLGRQAREKASPPSRLESPGRSK